VTFGSLNYFGKVNPGVLQQWATVLRAAPNSRLLLQAPTGSSRRWAAESLQGAGVDASRQEFLDSVPRAKYLELYHRIDIGLDTLPYNGHTTSLDSFWMGVPVITIVGSTIVGRAGLSQLANLGLQDLIANNEDEFVRIATNLAGDLPRLRALRATLRERMQISPLMDGARFVRNLEAAYRAMWQASARQPNS
jgi:predicted O-linked N-acetylglucosamine transferase (SPINDLY family)